MINFERQYNLFNNENTNYWIEETSEDIYIDKEILEEWQNKIINYQSQFFSNYDQSLNQFSLFESHSEELKKNFNLLDLTPLPLNFWKWPKAKHKGPALYFVMDKQIETEKHILLYIGETISADKRWKGDHDCKIYLSNYSESLNKAGLVSNLSIRFWLDVPIETKARRKLEQKLIQTWLPPFNKETRRYWSTPFTSQIN